MLPLVAGSRRGSAISSAGSGSVKWSNIIYFKDHQSQYSTIPINETILEMSDWKSPIFYAIPLGPVYHEFILMKTNKAYWSVEKGWEGITLARGTWTDVSTKYRNEKRRGKVKQKRPWRTAKRGSTISTLVNYLNAVETSRGFDLFLDNCQSFLDRLFSLLSV
jgi:hypothetical protein